MKSRNTKPTLCLETLELRETPAVLNLPLVANLGENPAAFTRTSVIGASVAGHKEVEYYRVSLMPGSRIIGRVASVGSPTEALPDPDKEISTIRLF